VSQLVHAVAANNRDHRHDPLKRPTSGVDNDECVFGNSADNPRR